MNNIDISVIMGIYNCELTLASSIESVLSQTHDNYEFIICDDGSFDDSYQIAESYQKMYPGKIILIRNEENMGLNFTLNKCLKIARGNFIARQDGDDISLANRFEKQLLVFSRFPELTIVGSAMTYFDENGSWGESVVVKYPTKFDFIMGTPFCHATAMIRRGAMLAVGGYSVSKMLLRVEDYHLWFKLYASGYKGFNIDEPLYQMFDGRDAYSRRKYKYRINEAFVKFIGFRMLKIPLIYYIYIFKPLLVGLLPSQLYIVLHKNRLKPKG